MPGIAKDKIEVSVEDRDVTIGVEYTEELEANGKALWRERGVGKASRAIRLPESVDANAAQAKHVDGVLQLTLPKLAKANTRQITIPMKMPSAAGITFVLATAVLYGV